MSVKRNENHKISKNLIKREFYIQLNDYKIENDFLYIKNKFVISNCKILYIIII